MVDIVRNLYAVLAHRNLRWQSGNMYAEPYRRLETQSEGTCMILTSLYVGSVPVFDLPCRQLETGLPRGVSIWCTKLMDQPFHPWICRGWGFKGMCEITFIQSIDGEGWSTFSFSVRNTKVRWVLIVWGCSGRFIQLNRFCS